MDAPFSRVHPLPRQGLRGGDGSRWAPLDEGARTTPMSRSPGHQPAEVKSSSSSQPRPDHRVAGPALRSARASEASTPGFRICRRFAHRPPAWAVPSALDPYFPRTRSPGFLSMFGSVTPPVDSAPRLARPTPPDPLVFGTAITRLVFFVTYLPVIAERDRPSPDPPTFVFDLPDVAFLAVDFETGLPEYPPPAGGSHLLTRAPLPHCQAGPSTHRPRSPRTRRELVATVSPSSPPASPVSLRSCRRWCRLPPR